ncbi:alpha-N-arabinofuranosidase [Candidatus Sumerlaeota bacterium]|nr:alpha-N-arabinofuranosidase [Candidatus Sumerlaeota bacterium]
MNRITIDADLGKETISRHIYGHFAEHLGRCIYGGIWVGEDSPIPNTRGIRNDIVEALRAIRIPNLRWPGGCFADEYHWMDGIGPKDQRPSTVNTHWGGVVENNRFGTHEFMDLCEQLGCDPYICGNVGSGTVREMQQWVEYVTCDVPTPMSRLRARNGREAPWPLPFFGVGNENWGCGGHMRPEYYADLFRRYATYVRNFGRNKVFKIACGPNDANYAWTEVLMREVGKQMNGLALHYYTWGKKAPQSSATEFDEASWFDVLQKALKMDELVSRHATIMDRFDPEKKIALVVDEWGTWYDVEPGTNPRFLYQQNTLRDALVASTTLDVFNRRCDRVKMANIAQTVNVLQAMVLTQNEKMLVTPSYRVFEMYRVHHDATLLPLDLECAPYGHAGASIPSLSASASRDAEGKVHLTVSNLDPNRTAEIECHVRGAEVRDVSGRVLTADAMNARNTFDAPDAVRPAPFDGARIEKGTLRVELPAKSIAVLEIA